MHASFLRLSSALRAFVEKEKKNAPLIFPQSFTAKKLVHLRETNAKEAKEVLRASRSEKLQDVFCIVCDHPFKENVI